MSTSAPSRWLRRLDGWATRSLAVGAAVTGLDVLVGMTALHLGASTRWAAMLGTAVGMVLSYFANRVFAFKADNPLARSLGTYLVVMVLSSVLHGQIVVWLRDAFGVHFVLSKMGADFLVFTLGHLLLLRYLVFPAQPATPAPPAVLGPRRPSYEALRVPPPANAS